MCFYMIKPIFAPLQPQKPPCSRFIYVACARTLYIGETSKTLLFAACVSLQPLSCSICMLVLTFVFGTFAAVFFCFRFHLLFVPRKLCVKHYASFCIFMQV